MNYNELFRAVWERLLLALPHDRQAEVMANPGGYEWRELAARAALATEGN